MNYRNQMAIVLAAVACAACSEPERGTDPVPASGPTRVMLQGEAAQQDISVYAFRQTGDRFLFDTLFREGWTPEGTLAVRMPNGRYRFLFVAGAGENTRLQPEPLTRQTAWEQVAFGVRDNDAVPGTQLSADQLFLQYPVADAERVYTLDGTDQTIPARLSRAVSQIVVLLKRGYNDGTKYVEVPYVKLQTVLDEVARVELSATNAGLSVTPGATAGTAVVAASLAAADYTELTDGGFVRLDGPFVLPPAGGAPLSLEVSVVPAAGAALQPARLQLTGTAERNKRLEVTLWITSGYPLIGVEIRTEPIEAQQDGDSGIWE